MFSRSRIPSGRSTCPSQRRKEGDAAKTFSYEGHDITTLQKLAERECQIPVPQMSEEVIDCLKVPHTEYERLQPRSRSDRFAPTEQ